MKIVAVLTVKNEGAFLIDWLAHHRAAGFTDILVLSNDCSDGTDAILDRLQDMGQLTHLRNPGPYDAKGVQFRAMHIATHHQIVTQADWIMALDIDEFVNIHTGDRTVGGLLAALPEATAITLTWRLFGNAGIARYADAPVTDTFTRCAPQIIHWPWRAAMFKTLFRNDGTYGALGVHRPRAPRADRLDNARWFDGAGRELDEDFKTRRIFSNYGQPNFALAQLNHYPLGAAESFVLKADRGRAVHSADQLGLDYWVERNFNSDQDTSIAGLASATHAIREELKADAILAHLHQKAVLWRQKRFEQLLQLEPNRALFTRLLMAATSQPVRPEDARYIIGFATGGRDNV